MRPRRRHAFAEDVELRDDRTGEQWCMCGLPASNQAHELPETPEGQANHEARRLGERGD